MRARAFSLVELVIVVVIIGIIAAIAIPRVSRLAESADEAALRADLATMRTAIELYAAEHRGTLPGSVSDGTNAAGTAKCFRWQLWYFEPLSGDPNPINPWKYDYTTGQFIFNWNAFSSDGVTQYDDF